MNDQNDGPPPGAWPQAHMAQPGTSMHQPGPYAPGRPQQAAPLVPQQPLYPQPAALPPGYQMHPQHPGYIWNPATNDVRPMSQPAAQHPQTGQPIIVNVSSSNQNVANATSHPSMVRAPTKSPGLAAFLSFFFVGLGQLYNGEVGKGILMFIGCVLLWTILLGWIVNIWSIVDAYTSADRINRLGA